MLLVYFVLLIILNGVENEKIWHSNFLDVPRKLGEDFTLKNIWVDENLSENFTANFWKSINLRNESHAVGVSNDEILLVKFSRGSDNFIINSTLKSINENYTDASFLEIWNKTSRKYDIFLLTVTSTGNLQLFNVENWDLFWSFNLETPVEFLRLNFNSILQMYQIFVATNNNIDIYNLQVTGWKLWLSETLQFENSVGSFDTTTYRDGFFLLVPQKTTGKLVIFKYKNNHFQNYKELNAGEIEQVVTFRENFKTFFAVNGVDAAIYQFGRRNIILKEKTNTHLQGIKYWLPVTLNNLSQKLILFAQRVLEHGTHHSFFTEIFTYNNEYFEKHDDIPCQIFGEKFDTQICVTHFEESIGIKGASYVSMGNTLGFVLAKSSHFFRVEFEWKIPESPIQVEIETLNETRNKLQKLLDEKLNTDDPDKVIKISHEKPIAGSRTSASFSEKSHTVLTMRSGENFSEKLDEMVLKLSELKTKMDAIEQVEKSGNFTKIVVNGTGIIENMSVRKVFSENMNGGDTDHILSDIVRKNIEGVVESTKTFADVDVENIFFESFNGVNASDILFEKENMIINGDVTFKNPVAVLNDIHTEKINDFPSASIVDMSREIPGVLTFENIYVDELKTREPNEVPENSSYEFVHFPQNVTVKKINGVDFEEFLKELCLINIPTHVTGTINIDGDIIVEDAAGIQYLNTIKFPENYLFRDGSTGVSITGRKNFLDTLEGFAIRTNDQYINGIKTTDFFTLSTKQDITKTTFSNLAITNSLEHVGKTIGGQVNKFLPNPTFLQTHIIKSNANFEELEVTGSIIIDENLNNINFQDVLEDIVYKDEKIPDINSIKEFPEGLTVRNNLNITSNSINLIPLDQFITKDTNQVLNIAQLTGNVSIETMEINQLINGFNITKLDEEIVKTSGEQFISSFLIFKDDLEVNNLGISEVLNEVPVENFLTINGTSNVFNKDLKLDELHAKNLVIRGNFNGNIQGINLEKFVENRMSYFGEQSVAENFNVENSRVDVINCDVESVYCGKMFDKKYLLEKIMDKISTGDIRVKDLIVDGDLNIEHLNGITLRELREFNEESLIINGDVHFLNLQINKLSGVNFGQMMENVVFKNETSFSISGTKTFEQGIVVDKLIETKKLNYIPIESLLTKEGRQEISAPLQIYGNVTFGPNLNVLKTLNDVHIHDLREYFGMLNNSYVIKSDMLFDRLAHVYNLEIYGNLNDKNVENIIGNMAYGSDLSFSEDFHFMDTVLIEDNLDIKNYLNDIDLSETNENVVYLNKTDDNFVDSAVTFASSDTLANNVVIETDLLTKRLTGIDLQSLGNNAVYLNKGYMPGFYHFENLTIHEKLYSNYVNKIRMNDTIPLGSNQEIHELFFENVAFLNDVSVGGVVNQRNMSGEYANSVLSGKEQEIFSELRFVNNTLIRKSLEVAGLWNGNPLNKMVTTDTNQNLTALYKFPTKINVNSNMYVNGSVNSIDMSIWENGAVKIVSKDTQIIEAPWHIKGNLTFKQVLDGDNIIYNFNIHKDMKIIQERNSTKNILEKQYKIDHESICKDINIFEEKLERQIYKFEMFEDVFVLNYPRIIGASYFFMGFKPTLLLNGVGFCTTDVFVFENDEFVKISDVETGEIEQIVSTIDGDSVYLITKSKSKSSCGIQGTNVWKFTNGTVEILQNIETQQQLQESLVPSTFYGLNKYGVTEFRINTKMPVAVYEYRKWKIHDENAAFVPRGLGTGLALRTGTKLIKLQRDDPINENEVGLNEILRGDIKELKNFILPGRNNNKLIVLNVGPKYTNKTLIAAVFHEDTVVGRNFDVLKIFEDHTDTSKIFQKIFTFNPTSLLTLNFGNGETLLIILENGEKLQVYQYRGIEGFQHRFSADVQGSYMFKMLLPLNSEEPVEVISVVDKNTVRIIKPVMIGNRIIERVQC